MDSAAFCRSLRGGVHRLTPIRNREATADPLPYVPGVTSTERKGDAVSLQANAILLGLADVERAKEFYVEGMGM